jgi:Lrp/AsnC family transcriptional regulator for asnA, asnC and gidA
MDLKKVPKKSLPTDSSGAAVAKPKNSRGASPKQRASSESPAVRSARPAPDRAHPVELDATDYRIIFLLRENGRASSRDLAHELGLTEATVRTRLRRMDASATMRVVAMTDFRAAGFQLMTSIGVQVSGRPVVEVAEDIARLPQIITVQIVIGTMDIELSGGAASGEELAELMSALWAVPGVYRLTPGMALEVIKFEWGSVPML